MDNEFEMISHPSIPDFKIFLSNLVYRSPHIHKDLEICLVLKGTVSVLTQGKETLASQGDFFVINPFQSHELKACMPVCILSLQALPSLFSAYFPQMEHLEFSTLILPKTEALSQKILMLALSYMEAEGLYELRCMGLLNLFLFEFMSFAPFRLLTAGEKAHEYMRARRIRSITDYISHNFHRKLLLGEIAEMEHLTVCYLSHFFKDYFGMSFQEYLLRIRCEKARRLLLTTDFSLLHISLSCGFSDAKYFNNGFFKQYGALPKEYRRHHKTRQSEDKKNLALCTQDFYSKKDSILILKSALSP